MDIIQKMVQLLNEATSQSPANDLDWLMSYRYVTDRFAMVRGYHVGKSEGDPVSLAQQTW